MQTIQAILTIIIAIGVALIGYQQYVVNKNRLKLELFEKRFKVYNELMKVLARALMNGDITRDELNAFGLCKSEGAFLFDSDLGEYLQVVFKKLGDLQAHNLYMSKCQNPTPEISQKMVDEIFEICNWIQNEFNSCKSRFDKYLQVNWH
jgi:hypothetical protein